MNASPELPAQLEFHARRESQSSRVPRWAMSRHVDAYNCSTEACSDSTTPKWNPLGIDLESDYGRSAGRLPLEIVKHTRRVIQTAIERSADMLYRLEFAS